MPVPTHLWGQCVRASHNGEMPRQLLRWVRHELSVVAIRGPINNRLGRLLPQLI